MDGTFCIIRCKKRRGPAASPKDNTHNGLPNKLGCSFLLVAMRIMQQPCGCLTPRVAALPALSQSVQDSLHMLVVNALHRGRSEAACISSECCTSSYSAAAEGFKVPGLKTKQVMCAGMSDLNNSHAVQVLSRHSVAVRVMHVLDD